VIVSTVSGSPFQFRLQIATLDGEKGDKPYKIMMARFILQEVVATSLLPTHSRMALIFIFLANL
jgi:hypothetical protein